MKKLILILLLFVLCACDFNSSTIYTRPYIIKIEKDKLFGIDSVVVSIGVEGSASKKMFEPDQFTVIEKDSLIEIISITVELDGSSSSYVMVSYQAYSNGIVCISNANTFDFDQNNSISEADIDTTAIKVLKEYQYLEGVNQNDSNFLVRKRLIDSLFVSQILKNEDESASALYQAYKNHEIHLQVNDTGQFDSITFLELLGDSLSKNEGDIDSVLTNILGDAIASDSSFKSILINQKPLVAVLVNDTVITLGDTILFRLDVTDDGGIKSFDWDFDSNGEFEVSSTTNLGYKKLFNDFGNVQISARVIDHRDEMSIATVNVLVNTPPTVVTKELQIEENSIGSIGLLVSEDVDSNVCTYFVESADYAIDSSTGEVTALTALDYELEKKRMLKVSVFDGLDTTTSEIFILAKDVNDNPPIITPLPIGYHMAIDEDVMGEIILTASDVDNEALEWTHLNRDLGTVTLESESEFVKRLKYQPKANQYGLDTISVLVFDGIFYDTLKIPVVVSETNDSPVIQNKPDQVITVISNGPLVSLWSYTFSDPDTPDLLSWSVEVAPTKGTANISSDGVLDYSVNSGAIGLDSFRVLLQDDRGGVDRSSLYILIQ